MPVHNAAPYLRQAVDSILAQSFEDFELLLINDGSTDASAVIISSYADPRIRVITNDHNIGLTATLNKGLDLCRGKYIARMDSDDIALPERFALQVNYLDTHPDVSVVAARASMINAEGEVTGEWSDDALHVSPGEIRRFMPFSNCLVHPSIMMRTAILKAYRFKENQKGAEDWDLWLRLLADGHRIAKLSGVLLHYRVHMQSTMAGEKKTAVQARLIRIKRKWLIARFPRLNAFYFTMIYSLVRSMASHFKFNLLPPTLRSLKRLLTVSPLTAARQYRLLKRTLEKHEGRVFLFFPYTHIGGAERVHADIAAAFRAYNPIVFFTAFSSNDKFIDRFQGQAIVLNIPQVLNYPFYFKRALRAITAHIEKQRSPLVLGSNSGYFYEVAARVSGNARIIDLIHAFKYQPGGNETHKKYLVLSAGFYKRIFVSAAAREEFRKFCFHQNCPAAYLDKLQLIYNHTRIPAFITRAYHAPLRVLFVGRNSEEKRLWLFESIAEQLNREWPGKFSFTVAGTRGTGKMINYLGEIADNETLAKQYASADVLVLTSHREGFPMVIMEAMAHGVVPVSTPVGDVPAHINPDRGFLTSSADAAVTVNEICQGLIAFSSDKSRLARLSVNSYNYAKSNFGAEPFTKAYQALLN